MAFTGTNPVSVGDATQKSHYDVLFDNTIYLRDNYKPVGAASSSTGTVNAHALPTGAGNLAIWWAGAADMVLNGITGGVSGQTLVLQNNVGFYITLNHESASASAANRLYWDWAIGGNPSIVLRPTDAAVFVYSNLNRWQLVSLFRPAREFDNGNSGTTKTIDFNKGGPAQKVTRNGSCTFTLVAPFEPGTCVLKMVHDATANVYTVTFSPSPKWPYGTAFTFTNTASAIDILTLYWDGSTWFIVGQGAFA